MRNTSQSNPLATHCQVYDTRQKAAVKGVDCMEYESIAETIVSQLNRRSRAHSPRYVVRRVDPKNLPMDGAA